MTSELEKIKKEAELLAKRAKLLECNIRIQTLNSVIEQKTPFSPEQIVKAKAELPALIAESERLTNEINNAEK